MMMYQTKCRWTWAAFSLPVLLAMPLTGTAEQISVISYNIYSYSDAGTSAYDALVRIVEALDPDILLLQEAFNSSGRQAFTAHFASRYPYNYLGAPYYESARNQIFSAYPIVQSGQIFTDDPNGGSFVRPTIWSDIDVQPGHVGAEVRVYSAHYKSGSASRDNTLRINQASDDADHVTDTLANTPDMYIVYAGDLNSLSYETPMQTLLNPATTLSRISLLNPNNNDDQTRWPSGRTIDHILYSGMLADCILTHYIFHSETFPAGTLPAPAQSNDSQTASDHLTLFASFDLPEYCPADLNGDGYVDSIDFDSFRQCLTGSNMTFDIACEPCDLDEDQDIDLSDYGLFQRCLSGPYEHPTANCLGN